MLRGARKAIGTRGRRSAGAAAALWARLKNAGPFGMLRQRGQYEEVMVDSRTEIDASTAESAWAENTKVVEEIARRGRQIYENLEKDLVVDSMHRWVRINVKTGEYVVGDSLDEVSANFRSRFGAAPSWDTRVGEAPYVFSRARILQ